MIILIFFRLPVLAGAAGALGATYCSPYLTVDGAYHARPSGQTSSMGASRLVACFSMSMIILDGLLYTCIVLHDLVNLVFSVALFSLHLFC
jgi:hypothetical protein